MAKKLAVVQQQETASCATCTYWEPTCKPKYKTASDFWCKEYSESQETTEVVVHGVTCEVTHDDSGNKLINGFPDPQTDCPTETEFLSRCDDWKTLKAEQARVKSKISEDQWHIISYLVHMGEEATVVNPDGFKFQWVRVSNWDYDETEGLAYCTAQAKSAKSKDIAKIFKDVIVEKTIYTFDWDAWERLKRAGHVPEEVLKRVEKHSYRYALRHWDLSNKECPNCSVQVTKRDKFCRNCGTNLVKK